MSRGGRDAVDEIEVGYGGELDELLMLRDDDEDCDRASSPAGGKPPRGYLPRLYVGGIT